MAITDELREFASHCAGGMGGDALRDIADRIASQKTLFDFLRVDNCEVSQ